MIKILFLLITAVSFVCTQQAKAETAVSEYSPLPGWLQNAVIYQIYPASFQDSNGDGIGDIPGIVKHLDYIHSIGCNTIWLNPCFHSAFRDGGYDVIDYYQVAPRYGRNKDLQILFAEAHKKGMKVILDLVAGHTSNECPWFTQSQSGKSTPYNDRYIWTNDSSLCPTKFIKGEFGRNGCYLKNYFDFQPALNYGYGEINPQNPWEEPLDATGPTETRRELMHIMDYWMEMGCDGFRIDMAGSLVKNDPQLIGTKRLWNEVRQHFQRKWPEGVMIAEWGHPEKAKDIGFMADFLFQFGIDGYRDLFFNEVGVYRRDTCFFDKRGLGNAKRFINSFENSIKATSHEAYICIPTGNHDVQRLNCGVRNSIDELKVAMTFILTQQAIPCIYYGDEIGMRYMENLPDVEGSCVAKGNRAGSRTPMQWDNTCQAGFSTASDSMLYLPLPTREESDNVSEQENDKSSLLNYIRQLLIVRNKYNSLSLLSNTKFLVPENKSSYPLSYLRMDNSGEKIMICINPSAKKQTATYSVEDINSPVQLMSCGGKVKISVKNKKIHIVMPAVTAAIYIVKP